MLVLSRRQGEKIVIGNEVIVEVLAVSGDGVRLGITAPAETSVHRYEVFAEIEGQNRASGAGIEAETAIEDLAAHMRAKKDK